jgi:hypothetical protein
MMKDERIQERRLQRQAYDFAASRPLLDERNDGTSNHAGQLVIQDADSQAADFP